MTEKYHSLKNKDLRTKTLSSLKSYCAPKTERKKYLYSHTCLLAKMTFIMDSFKKIIYF